MAGGRGEEVGIVTACCFEAGGVAEGECIVAV